MSKTKAFLVAAAAAILCLLVSQTGVAQTCPSVGQSTGPNNQPDNGLLNGANVTIDVVGSTLQGADNMVQAAANNWAAIPGATFTFNIQNVDSVPSGSASASDPVIIFQMGPASDFAQNGVCSGALMCSMAPQLDANGNVVLAQIEFDPGKTTSNSFFQRAFDHELGHDAFGLDDCDDCDPSVTIMASPLTTAASATDIGPTTCDQGYVYRNSSGAYGKKPAAGGGSTPPLPPPCPTGPQQNRGTGGGVPCNTSPIIIDTEGEGFHLTSLVGGVMFDIAGDGQPVQIAWTDSRYRNAFLALPGADGLVHNGKELFGNFTPQPPSANPNGFIALAQYDQPANGGNGDGVIDERDAVFSRLRLWIDANHDGICQPGELHALTELGIHSLALNYVDSRRTDEFGNEFRYKARVNPGGTADFRDERQHGDQHEAGRWSYDVFLVTK